MSGYEPPRRMSGDHRPAGRTDLVRDNAGHATLSISIHPEVDPAALEELGRRMAEMSVRFQEMRTAMSSLVQSASRASEAFRTAFPEGWPDAMRWTAADMTGPEDAGEESPGDDGGTSRPA